MSRARWFRLSPLLGWTLPLWGVFAVACASGGSNDEFPDSGGGQPPVDSGSGDSANLPDGQLGGDAPNLGDVSKPGSDGGAQDGGADGAMKGDSSGSDSGAMDGGIPDTGAKDTGGKDSPTSDGSTCVAVTLNSGANDGGACPAPVSGTCGMGDIAGFTPTWVPPSGYHQGLCTTKQMDDFYTDCFASGATETSCDDEFTAAPDCAACIFTDEGSATYGPIIDTTNGLSEINEGGCIALLEPCNLTCAEEVLGAFQCENAACETNCPVTDGGTLDSFETCETTAANCDPNGCDVFATESTCANELTGKTHPASACVTATTFEDYYNAVVPVFCGP